MAPNSTQHARWGERPCTPPIAERANRTLWIDDCLLSFPTFPHEEHSMNSAVKTYSLGAVLATACMSSHAEVIALKLTPGLWEETRVTMVNGRNVEESMRKGMEKMMANLTPEQRKA